jgi:hypothetical protein
MTGDDDADGEDEGTRRLNALLWMGLGLLIASGALLSGTFAAAVTVIGGLAVATSVIVAYASEPGDDERPPVPCPARPEHTQAVEPARAIDTQPPAAEAVRRWLERVERTAGHGRGR